MHIILFILKIIGRILLGVLAVFLGLLMLLLFVPVRYEAKGSYIGKTPVLQGRIRYLFPLLQLRFSYGETRLLQLRICGILIKDFLAPPKKKPDGKKQNRRQGKKSDRVAARAGDTAGDDAAQNMSETERQEKRDDKEKPALPPEQVQQAPGFIASLLQKCRAIWQKLKETKDNVAARREQILSYLAFWQREDVQKAVAIAKTTLFKVLRSIAPRKLRIRLRLGLGDPASTGQLCGFYGMIYPFVGNYVIMEPDFEQAIYEGDFYLKGKVTFFVLVKAGCVFLFHKDFKCIRNLIMHKEVADE